MSKLLGRNHMVINTPAVCQYVWDILPCAERLRSEEQPLLQEHCWHALTLIEFWSQRIAKPEAAGAIILKITEEILLNVPIQGNSHLFVFHLWLTCKMHTGVRLAEHSNILISLTWWNSESNQDTSEKTHASWKIDSFKRPVWAWGSQSHVLTWETQRSHPKGID